MARVSYVRRRRGVERRVSGHPRSFGTSATYVSNGSRRRRSPLRRLTAANLSAAASVSSMSSMSLPTMSSRSSFGRRSYGVRSMGSRSMSSLTGSVSARSRASTLTGGSRFSGTTRTDTLSNGSWRTPPRSPRVVGYSTPRGPVYVDPRRVRRFHRPVPMHPGSRRNPFVLE